MPGFSYRHAIDQSEPWDRRPCPSAAFDNEHGTFLLPRLYEERVQVGFPCFPIRCASMFVLLDIARRGSTGGERSGRGSRSTFQFDYRPVQIARFRADHEGDDKDTVSIRKTLVCYRGTCWRCITSYTC